MKIYRPPLVTVPCPRAGSGTPSLREVRAGGWSELSPRCVGAAARRAGLSPLFSDAPISRRPVCFLMHTLSPFGPAELGGFFPGSRGRILSLPAFQIQGLSSLASPAGSSEKESAVTEPSPFEIFLSRRWASYPPPRPKTFKFLGVAGGTIERSCYSPHYV